MVTSVSSLILEPQLCICFSTPASEPPQFHIKNLINEIICLYFQTILIKQQIPEDIIQIRYTNITIITTYCIIQLIIIIENKKNIFQRKKKEFLFLLTSKYLLQIKKNYLKFKNH